jgi:predicted nucleotidyltransferase
MSVMTETTIREMVEAVVQETQPEMVYVFGSYAKNQAREDSDIDLLIIENEGFGPERSRWAEVKRIRRALSPFRIPKDILVFSKVEFDYWKGAPNHVVAQAAKDGRLAYARS